MNRIEPLVPPFPSFAEEAFARLMPPGVPPLTLFTTLARDPRLFARFMGGGLLDRGHLTIRQREIVIARVTAANGAEYEWGVHVTFFGAKAGFDAEAIAALASGDVSAPCWTAEERVLLRICEALHVTSDVDDATWSAAREHFGELALVEVLLLAGFYRTVSYLVKGLRLPLEPWAARFPADAMKPAARGADQSQ